MAAIEQAIANDPEWHGGTTPDSKQQFPNTNKMQQIIASGHLPQWLASTSTSELKHVVSHYAAECPALQTHAAASSAEKRAFIARESDLIKELEAIVSTMDKSGGSADDYVKGIGIMKARLKVLQEEYSVGQELEQMAAKSRKGLSELYRHLIQMKEGSVPLAKMASDSMSENDTAWANHHAKASKQAELERLQHERVELEKKLASITLKMKRQPALVRNW